MKRPKTIKIVAIIDDLHARIRGNPAIAAKQAYCEVIADLLHANGAYNGFTYTFWTSAIAERFKTVQAAIDAGLGTEYDREYATYAIRF